MRIRKHAFCTPVAIDWLPDDDDDDSDVPAILEGLRQALPSPSDGRWTRCFLEEGSDYA